MTPPYTEADVEEVALDCFQELGYQCLHGEVIAPDAPASERVSHADVLLEGRLQGALARLNPHLPQDALDDVLRKLKRIDTPDLTTENRRLHRMFTDGVDVDVVREDGSIGGDKAWLVDFVNPDNNDWLAVNQFTVIEGGKDRRPDVVVFLNGLPVAVIELKNPGKAQATVETAFNQLQTYKAEIPSLFRSNMALVVSDGLKARMGSLTAGFERFMPWRTVDGRKVEPKGKPELGTLLAGVFRRDLFLEYLRGFVVFESDGEAFIKKIAGYHQFHAVRKAVESTVRATGDAGDQKAGVIWHTQGSGKSLLMAFYAGRIIVTPEMANPTLVVITDRNDLDEQLYNTFCGCSDLIRQTPVKAESRSHLRELLHVASGGVVFTTIQKFWPESGADYPLLTDRRNLVVIADEAHRSQYGFKAKVSQESGEISYGFAKYIRDALPRASFLGFTGTPIEQLDVNTPAVFGEYIDIYDIQRAVEDEATVPIFYESRLARVELDPAEKAGIDGEVEALLGEADEPEAERMKAKWAQVEALVGSEKRLRLVAQDIVQHFEDRVAAMQGKAMVVCMSRRICVELYKEIIALRPEWDSDDDKKGKVKVVMTGSASDPTDWQPHIGSKSRRDLLAKRAKNPEDELSLVLVRDMWLTGFDAPSMHTMYMDKPMKGHGLMQAIARVNRVFRDKAGGLVVDYIGLAHNLKEALKNYSPGDRGNVGINEEQAVAVMLEKYEVVKAMYHGFDYSPALTGTPKERLHTIALAMEWILDMQRRKAADAKGEKAKKKAWRRYADAVLALSKAFSLAAASDEARRIREEVGFFQTVQAALAKSRANNRHKKADLDFAVQQIVSRAVISTDIVDILEAAGMDAPNISVLSDEFLFEMRELEHKNLALEALKKLVAGQIASRLKTSVVKHKEFSSRLEEAIQRYHMNAITTVQVLEELIKLAQEIRDAKRRGEEEGLSEEEVAFYDALAENESARDVMGDAKLKVIAHELLMKVKASVGVDWSQSRNARARIRLMVKKILKQYGYPPDLEEEAVRTVLEQAEALSAQWAGEERA
jgi:type I restriction enzyme R subunit